jgi:hypothetical protein
MTSEPLQASPAAPEAVPGLLRQVAALPRESLFLSAMIVCSLVDVFTGWRPAAFIAVPFLSGYFALLWSKIIVNGRILLMCCGAVAAIAAFQQDAAAILGAGSSRMIYLPAFVAMLSFLRAAAGASPIIASAARHLVNQPPPRRYIALSFGGHFFGILLNIGGLALLVEMLRDANTLEAAGGDADIVAWRQRRMTVAVLRGFAAITFWSPLGVSFNLLLVSIPGLTWGQAAPIGLACAASFIGLGWVFDQFQRPKGLRAPPVGPEPGGAGAVATMIAHVAAVSALTWAVEALLRLSFQTALLLAIPAYAFAWAFAAQLSQGRDEPLKSSAALMIDRGVASFPAYANEIAVFAASGFLGAALVALVPREVLQAMFHSLPVAPGVLAGMLVLAVAAFGFLGLNPMIGATILASAVSSAEVPGLPKTAIALAIAAGWACTVVASPMNSALVMTSMLIQRRPWTLAIGWNGPFAIAALAASILVAGAAVQLHLHGAG